MVLLKLFPGTTLLLFLISKASIARALLNEKTIDMVVTAHPLATAAGEKILQAGGTAADAMVAIQAVLGLVEPQSSGIGGGAFVVYYDSASGETITFDGRETAPAAAAEDRFEGIGFLSAWQSGLSVGVPGVPRLMKDVHQRFGRLIWNEALFQDGIDLAKDGFKLSQRTEDLVNRLLDFNAQIGFDCEKRSLLWRDPIAFEYFINTGDGGPADCFALPAGTIKVNTDYAATLKLSASQGADGFYAGDMAEAIVAAVQNDTSHPGDMTVSDLMNYKVIERLPVCLKNYRGKRVCGMGPPSSGGLAVGQMLGILNTFEVLDNKPLSADAVHLFSQAGRLAFADRNLYVGDTDFVTVPVEGMLDVAYLAERASLITMNGSDIGIVEAGIPPGVNINGTKRGADNKVKTTGTSHVSIVDRCGNALSMTTTIESPFGNGVMVNGFLLNNELTDFSFAAKDEEGTYISNRVQPKKRPRSSMSPTIIFNESGLLEAVTGSPGGSQIIGYTAQSIYNMFDFGLDPESAAALPHYQNNNADKTSIEIPIDNVTLEYAIDNLTLDLENRGHVVRHTSMNSGLSIILVSQEDGMLLGGADPRRDGTVGSTVMSDEETDTSYFCPPSSSSHKSSKSHKSKKMKISWSYKSKSSKSNKSKKSKISWSYKSKSSKSQKNRKNTIAY